MTRMPLILVLVLLLLVFLTGIALAGRSSDDGVRWRVLGTGGEPAASASGRVTLNGTLGQTANGLSMAARSSLGAGFWYGWGRAAYKVYLPLVLRSH